MEVPADHPIHYEAARHSLHVRQLIDSPRLEGHTRWTLQLVYQPSQTYRKYFTTAWEDDPERLLDETTRILTQTEDTMNIFKTGLFKYLSAEMIGDKPITLTIAGAGEETLTNSKGSEKKPVVRFKESNKHWVLNKTNARALAEQLGPETNNWMGCRVTLFAEEIFAFGSNMKTIRVDKVLPPVTNGKAAEPEAEDAPLFAEESTGAFEEGE